MAPDFTDSSTQWVFQETQEIETTGWKLTYLPEEVEPTEELILSTTVNDGENLEEIEVSHADGTNSSTLNSYRLANGVITNTWNRRGESDNSNILSLFLKQLGVLRGEYTRELNALVIGEIDVFNTIKQTTVLSNQYYIKTYDWNIATNEYNLTLFEIGRAGVPVIIGGNPRKEAVSIVTNDNPLITSTGNLRPVETFEIPTQTINILSDQRLINNYICVSL